MSNDGLQQGFLFGVEQGFVVGSKKLLSDGFGVHCYELGRFELDGPETEAS